MRPKAVELHYHPPRSRTAPCLTLRQVSGTLPCSYEHCRCGRRPMPDLIYDPGHDPCSANAAEITSMVWISTRLLADCQIQIGIMVARPELRSRARWQFRQHIGRPGSLESLYSDMREAVCTRRLCACTLSYAISHIYDCKLLCGQPTESRVVAAVVERLSEPRGSESSCTLCAP